MGKILSIIFLIIAIFLFPPAVLAGISQNAIPGDSLYPIKRAMEKGVLTLVSIHPTTKAWFSIDYSGRRFSEATRLITKGENIQAKKSLNELVSQTSEVASAITTIKNQAQKRKLLAELNRSINQYQEGLTQAKQQAIVTSGAGTTSTTSPPLATQPTQPDATLEPASTPQQSPTTTSSLSDQSIGDNIEETIKELDEIEETLKEEEGNLDFLEDDEGDDRVNRGRGDGDERGRGDKIEGKGKGRDD